MLSFWAFRASAPASPNSSCRRTRWASCWRRWRFDFPSFGELIARDRLQPSFVANLNGDRFVSDPAHATRRERLRADSVRRRRRLAAHEAAQRLSVITAAISASTSRTAASIGCRFRKRCCGSSSAAAAWAPGCCSKKATRGADRAGARRAARLRVQSAGRQPADHVREVCRRQQEPADRPDQRFARQQRLRDRRQALRLRRDRHRRTRRRALGVDHRRRTRPPRSRPRIFAGRRARRPKRR